MKLLWFIVAAMILVVACQPVSQDSNETLNLTEDFLTETITETGEVVSLKESPEFAAVIEATEGDLVKLDPKAVDPDGEYLFPSCRDEIDLTKEHVSYILGMTWAELKQLGWTTTEITITPNPSVKSD